MSAGSASVIGLLSLYGIFRFQLGYAFFYVHDPILEEELLHMTLPKK